MTVNDSLKSMYLLCNEPDPIVMVGTLWSHEHYNRQDPQDKAFEYITMKRIQSDKHKLYTVE